jgi:hypothetical protein
MSGIVALARPDDISNARTTARNQAAHPEGWQNHFQQ